MTDGDLEVLVAGAIVTAGRVKIADPFKAAREIIVQFKARKDSTSDRQTR